MTAGRTTSRSRAASASTRDTSSWATRTIRRSPTTTPGASRRCTRFRSMSFLRRTVRNTDWRRSTRSSKERGQSIRRPRRFQGVRRSEREELPGTTRGTEGSREMMTRRAFGQVIGAAAVASSVPVRAVENAQQASLVSAEELCHLSASDLAARIRTRQVSARDVMAAHLAQIERINPTVNAIVTLVAERAMADAARADERRHEAVPLARFMACRLRTRTSLIQRGSARHAARRSTATTCRRGTHSS